ncbi:DUF2946 domain-containing protein [Burkholderia multivorans]|uniref:DUF2946 domain-containing protein n=1 Tax=Burkholderia multivorans TaxID=87883 RepID=A0AB37APG3_9BURK|nr:DUF2946 domain-containing protein [Burkholderia multivorans]PRE45410.1 DUF2946 domain-containing protein [Burkholderia multivorans]PRE52096.1 DUF2946 domain-containing protein [Burkholderia multivorans]
MSIRTRNLKTAWLGLIAMCLIVFAPLISQLIVANQPLQPEATLCSASSMAEHNPQSHPVSLAACGYCDLLATHSAIPHVPGVTLPLLVIVVAAALRLLTTRFTPLGAFPSGLPRAPPVDR